VGGEASFLRAVPARKVLPNCAYSACSCGRSGTPDDRWFSGLLLFSSSLLLLYCCSPYLASFSDQRSSLAIRSTLSVALSHVCVWCVVCGVWCVVCGVWCVVCVCVCVWCGVCVVCVCGVVCVWCVCVVRVLQVDLDPSWLFGSWQSRFRLQDPSQDAFAVVLAVDKLTKRLHMGLVFISQQDRQLGAKLQALLEERIAAPRPRLGNTACACACVCVCVCCKHDPAPAPPLQAVGEQEPGQMLLQLAPASCAAAMAVRVMAAHPPAGDVGLLR
jgi:hypothetical protein